jgi:hypothetical protein
VRTVLRDTGALDEVRDTISSLLAQARAVLNTGVIPPEPASALLALSGDVVPV